MEAQSAILAGLAGLTTAQAIEALAEHSVPAGPVLTRDQVFDDPQVQHNDLIQEWALPTGETLLQPGPPGTFSATQPEFKPWIEGRISLSSASGLDSIVAAYRSVLSDNPAPAGSPVLSW